MDPHSILDPSHTPELTAPEKPADWPGTQATDSTAPEIRFPGEDGGKSLAGMAQKDLTATLQLLAEQAQYITGASGAAIALRDQGEMVCRASAGSSAPEVGSLLQVNSGLSGESVRTRQTLRCDDAATDLRVNRESCEALGIASVVVMPLVQSNEVIGVFELFSDKAHVFQERDITALERMGAMVFGVLEHAMAAHGVTIWPDRANREVDASARTAGPPVEIPAISVVMDATAAEETSNTIDGTQAGEEIPPETSGVAGKPSRFSEIPGSVSGIAVQPSTQDAASSALPPTGSPESPGRSQEESDDILVDIARPRESSSEMTMPTHDLPPASANSEDEGEDSILDGGQISPATATEKHISAEGRAISEPADAPAPARSSVASLKKCEACGFPISEGRRLCLDCEKKQVQAGNPVSGPVAAVERAHELASGDGHRVAVNQPIPAVGPQFLSDEQDEVSWLASHKYMIVAIIMAMIIIGALLLAR